MNFIRQLFWDILCVEKAMNEFLFHPLLFYIVCSLLPRSCQFILSVRIGNNRLEQAHLINIFVMTLWYLLVNTCKWSFEVCYVVIFVASILFISCLSRRSRSWRTCAKYVTSFCTVVVQGYSVEFKKLESYSCPNM